MVIRVSVFIAVVLALRPSPAAERSCGDCKGSGEVECAACKGDGTVVVPCGECVAGKATCENCRNGQVVCTRCGGKGSKPAMLAGRIEWGRGSMEVPCPPTARCPKCSGDALVGCKACGKRGRFVVQCFFCEGGKKERCLPCYGTGKVGEPDPEPTAGTLREERSEKVRGDQEADLRESTKILEETARSASKVDQDRRAVLDGMARLGTRIDALAKRASEEPALRQAAEHLRRRWKVAQGYASETAREIEGALSGALPDASPRKGTRLTPNVESGKSVARSSMEDGIASARRQRKDIAAARGRVSGLVEDLRLREKEVGGFEARLKDYLASKELERKKAEDVRVAYRRVEEKIASLARRGDMPVLECELLESPSPAALRVQLTHFDGEATVSETREDSVPCDASLARIPPLVSGVLRECPEVDRIRVVVDANCLTETGLEDRQPIQRFTMERRRWKELVSGRYKGEWRTLLSKSQPAPEYPRPTRIPEGTWLIVALLGICFLGLAIVLAVRTRMLA